MIYSGLEKSIKKARRGLTAAIYVFGVVLKFTGRNVLFFQVPQLPGRKYFAAKTR